MLIYVETESISKTISLLREAGYEKISIATDKMSAALDEIVQQQLGDDYEEDIANEIVDMILDTDVFKQDIPNAVRECYDDIVQERADVFAELESNKEEWIDWAAQEYNLSFWNWEKKCFDEPGTFNWEDHYNDDYFGENWNLIKNVVDCGDNHYMATIVTADDDNFPHVFSPGFHFVNRLGYVVYKADAELDKDYWV